jgi:TonB-dependent SusC/RagA subfamily outer membrane receptor
MGEFTIICNPIDKLKVTANGFYPQKVKIDPNIKIALINLKLKPGPENREYAIGYGHVSDANKLNAVISLSDKQIFSQYSDIYELIRVRCPNVDVVNGEVIIRGAQSISGSTAALIVVDGIQVDNSALNAISPNQVKSINVIKDGSSAIYGGRGANGVVVIELEDGLD